MSSNVKRLRTSSQQERRTLAIELAKNGDSEILAELKRMVKGRFRKGFKDITMRIS